MNAQAFVDSLPLYTSGLVTTVGLLLLSIAFGLAAALPLAVARASRSRWLSMPVWCFTYVFRGTPMLVQLFLLYYGAAQFDVVRDSAAWPLLSSAWFCCVVAFAVNTCAYTTEIIAGGLRTVAPGEIEAARSLGFRRLQLILRITLPSALRRSLPAYSNEVILMLHGTSIASIVTLMDLTGAAREMNSRTFLPFQAFITAAVCYMVLTFMLVGAFHQAEKRWMAYLQPRQARP